MRLLLLLVVLLSWLIGGAPPLLAQTPATRAEALRETRAAKARAVTPNAPEPLLRGMEFVEGRALFLLTREGLHPKLGSLTTGSGFAAGVGYRSRAVFGHEGVLEVWTAASAKQYWAIETRATFPELAHGRVMTEAVASLREYPREDFFGLGPDSLRQQHSTFSLRTARLGGRAAVRLAPLASVGGGLEFLRPRAGAGQNNRVPSVGDLFTGAEAPGLGVRTDFLRSSVFVDIDYREPLNARRGGWYRLEVSRFADRDHGRFTFTRTDLDVRQFIGLLADRRVIALRGFVSTSEAANPGTAAAGTGGIPFYLMPSLGGNDTLRGFRNYRFRGPHALLLQAEYRWEIWSGLDGAFFYDAGRVARRRRDLGFTDLERNWGVGFRFNTANGVVMRVDAAFGSRDGKHLHIVFGGVF